MTVEDMINNNPGLGRRELARKFPEIGQGVFRKELKRIADETSLEDMSDKSLSKLQKQKQNAQDTARITNKILREKNREDSVIEVLNDKFVQIFSTIDLPVKIEHEFPGDRYDAQRIIVNLSDFHAQEEIKEDFNQFNFFVLAQRLEKLADHALELAEMSKAVEIIVIATGDLINSDRRKAEVMVNATNRTRASILCATLIEQFILSLYSEYPVRVAFVCGNESRVDKDHGHEDALISDNFDFSVYNMLKMMLRHTDILFEDGRGSEQVIEVGKKSFLALHGDASSFGQDPRKGVTDKIAQYAMRGILIDYVIFGHLHGSMITDKFARCGSLCGGNAYSTYQLGFSTEAAQNVFIVGDDIMGVRISLQNASDYVGYEVDQSIIGYEPK